MPRRCLLLCPVPETRLGCQTPRRVSANPGSFTQPRPLRLLRTRRTVTTQISGGSRSLRPARDTMQLPYIRRHSPAKQLPSAPILTTSGGGRPRDTFGNGRCIVGHLLLPRSFLSKDPGELVAAYRGPRYLPGERIVSVGIAGCERLG